MLFSNMPYSFKQAMFAEAAKEGASEIRVDVDLSAIFYTSPSGVASPPDWSSVDQYVQLARAYHLPVLAVLTAVPDHIARCPAGVPPDQTYKCAADATGFAAEAGQVARHAAGMINDFGILNEPDNELNGTYGTPQQYAGMLTMAYQAIHRANPFARVLLGGVSGSSAVGWLQQVFAAPGVDAAHSFDVANVHIRDSVAHLSGLVHAWQGFFAGYGFNGALWVTEHGYPADPNYQYDGAFRGTDGQSGLAEQAAYLNASVPALVNAGASKVFVTLRDDLDGGFASEGVVGGTVADPVPANPFIFEKPSFGVIRALADSYTNPPLAPPVLSAPVVYQVNQQPRGRTSLSLTDPRRSVEGRASGCPVAAVTIQRRYGGRWRALRTLQLGRSHRYRTRVRPGRYRAVSAGTTACMPATSRAVRVR